MTHLYEWQGKEERADGLEGGIRSLPTMSAVMDLDEGPGRLGMVSVPYKNLGIHVHVLVDTMHVWLRVEV